jgi:DNA-binding response OmpR family regulator
MGAVLVVDADVRRRTHLVRSLGTEGYAALGAANSADALDLVAARVIDLVVLDPALPGYDGLAWLGALTAGAGRPPVMVLSAGDPAAQARALDLGAVDVLVKPVDLRDLVASIRRHLAGSGVSAPTPRGPAWAAGTRPGT